MFLNRSMTFCRAGLSLHGTALAFVLSALLFPLTVSSNQIELERCQSLEDDDPNAAIALAEQLLEKIHPDRDPDGYGRALGCLGWSLATVDRVDDARRQSQALQKLANDMPVNQQSINLLRRSGSIFHRLGDRISASENYATAMERAAELGLVAEQIPLLVNLGVLNSEIREHERAIADYSRALELMEQIDDHRYRAPVLFNLAVTLSGQDRYDESLDAFSQVEALINQHWPVTRVASVRVGIATAHAGKGDYHIAKSKMQTALELFSQFDNPHEEMSAIASYASILNRLGERDDALTYAGQAYEYFITQNNVFNDSGPLLSLASVYESQGLYEQALDILRQVREKDQQFQETFNRESIAEMEARLRDSQQREELAELKNQNALNQIRLDEERNQRWLGLIIAAFVVAATMGFVWWQNRMNKQLKLISQRDSLTQLPNRRGIRNWLDERSFPQSPASRLLWLIDLDHFKQINDQHGHEVGDQVLQQIARCLTDQINSDKIIGRWGGEEFILITEDLSEHQIPVYAQNLLHRIAQTQCIAPSGNIQVTASIGVSRVMRPDSSGWNAALSSADKALYQAKDQGRNRAISAVGESSSTIVPQ